MVIGVVACPVVDRLAQHEFVSPDFQNLFAFVVNELGPKLFGVVFAVDMRSHALQDKRL